MITIRGGLIDTHCHLTDERYEDEDISLLLRRCNEAGVTRFICVGTSHKDSIKSILFATERENVYASYGIHPSCIANETEFFGKKNIDYIEDIKENPKLIAIGECGLDYYWKNYINKKDIQIKYFIKQLEASIKLNLPLIIHVRDAHDDMIKILKKYPKARGVIHCFTGTSEYAKEYLELGFYISLSGIITFKNADKIINAVKIIPLNKLLVETDSPYLTPEPFRGKKNYPYFVKNVVEKLSSIKGISYQEMVKIISINASKLFNI